MFDFLIDLITEGINAVYHFFFEKFVPIRYKKLIGENTFYCVLFALSLVFLLITSIIVLIMLASNFI